MENKLHILHMCLSSGFGGLEMYPIRTGKTMLEQGHKIYGIAQSHTPIDEQMKDGFDDYLALPSRGYACLHLLAIAKWIKQHKIAYVHCHKSSDLLVAVLLKKLCGFKLIYTDHMGAKKPKKDVFHRFIYQRVDLLLSISGFTRAKNVEALPIDKRKIKKLWLGTKIPHLVDSTCDVRGELGLSAGTILVGIVGRLSNGKGHLELLKAFERLDNAQMHLVIVGGLTPQTGGDEEYVAMLKAYVAEHRLQSCVTFYGFTTEPSVLLAAIDIVVIPSHCEAFGLTVIEAMAMGKAIIGSSHGAIPEIINDSGVLVDPFDIPAFCHAIETLSRDEEARRRLSQLARERAVKHFDQTLHTQMLLDLYRAC